MSHIVKMEAQFKSLADIVAAGERLGWVFMPGQRTYRWYGRYMADWPLPEGMRREDIGKCHHAFRVPGASYEVGIFQEADGTFSLRADWYQSGGLLRTLGVSTPEEFSGRFSQAYALEATKRTLRARGKRVTEKFDKKTGSVKLTVTAGSDAFGSTFDGGF